MNFHFENENYLRKVDSFRVISEKLPKNENFHLFFFWIFYNVASRNFGGENSDLDSAAPKKYICKKSELPAIGVHLSTIWLDYKWTKCFESPRKQYVGSWHSIVFGQEITRIFFLNRIFILPNDTQYIDFQHHWVPITK